MSDLHALHQIKTAVQIAFQEVNVDWRKSEETTKVGALRQQEKEPDFLSHQVSHSVQMLGVAHCLR